MKKILTTLAITSALTLSGCSSRIADLTVASSKNVNLNSSGLVTGARIKDDDTVPIILFPLGKPEIKEAVDNAIEQNKCAVGLTNVVIDQTFFSFIVGFIAYEVEGNLIIDREKEGCADYHTNSETPVKLVRKTRTGANNFSMDSNDF